jgi:hypothetical protein
LAASLEEEAEVFMYTDDSCHGVDVTGQLTSALMPPP